MRQRLRAALGDPRQLRQRLAISLLHPGVAAQLLHQHRGTDLAARHHVLADLAEAEAAMEQQHRVVAVVEEHLAGQLRVRVGT